MASNTAATNARVYREHMVHYLRKKITFADHGLTKSLGFVPAGATAIRGGVVVETAFNGDSANTLIVGTAADTDGFATALALGTIGVIPFDEMATTNDAGAYAVDTEIVCVVTSTAAASAGVGYVWVEYLVPQGSD